ncbi:hypothetical protein [Halopenitus malekzadehii]|nr:hypothetical protein [Halopenitus malekzadehii]
MTLHLGRAINDGIKRVLTPTGGILLVVFLALQLVTQASINTAVISVFPPGPAGEIEAALGMTLPVSGTVAGGLFVGAVVLSSAYFVVLSRALTRPSEELSSFPSDLYTRRMGRATLSLFVGGLIVGPAIMIGFVLLFLPGIFLAVSFLFFTFAVGVEDRGIIGGLKRSWGLSRENRLKLAVIVILAGVIGFISGIVGTLFDLASAAIVGELIVNTLNSVLFVLLYGIIAAAYLQVETQDDSPNRVNTSGVSNSHESVGS